MIRNYHYKFAMLSMPKTKHFMGKDIWVKGDMVYTFAFHRLDAVCIGKGDGGRRIYHSDRLRNEQMSEIYRCVLHGIGMSFLCQHIV